jgi:penicillin-binding protein 2
MIFHRKFTFFSLSILIGICILCIRLFYLQIYAWNYFSIKSNNNFLRLQTIKSPRGNIVDRHNLVLATNQPIHDVYWIGSGNKTLSIDQVLVIDIIASILPLDDKKIDIIKMAEKRSHCICIAQEISYEQLSKITEQFPNNSNIQIQNRIQRHYPFGSFACHLIGYLGSDIIHQKTGKMGLEKFFDEKLKGFEGATLHAINSFGKNIETLELKKPLSGNIIQTTLDMNIQMIGESVFPDHLTGTLIVLDPLNGDILAMLSRPAFDPHIFLKTINQQQWKTLQENSTFLNRALMLYPPGSTFKLVTASAALEHNLVTSDISWRCKGYSVFCGRKYWCAHKKQHGILSLKEAVAQSCNTLFFEIGKKIDIDILANYAHFFGLGTETGIIFNEQKGLVPTRAWKRITKGEPWWPGETLSVTIGQSFLLVSPLQIARMIGSIFTGYLVRPRILIDETIDTQPLLIQPSTCKFLQKSMKSVIRRGTGKRLQMIKNLEIYAKTSTAQISSLEKSKTDSQYKEHGWFATYFNYANTKPLVLVILVEKAGNSQTPTIIAKNFIIEYKKQIDALHASAK